MDGPPASRPRHHGDRPNRATKRDQLFNMLIDGGMPHQHAVKAANDAVAGGDPRPVQEIAVDVVSNPLTNWSLPSALEARVFHTALGDLATQDRPMGSLVVGDRFVGPDGRTVYEVTSPPELHGQDVDNPHVSLDVRDLSMTDEEAAALLAEPGAVEEGYDPRDGFFTYVSSTQLHRVLDGSSKSATGETSETTSPARRLVGIPRDPFKLFMNHELGRHPNVSSLDRTIDEVDFEAIKRRVNGLEDEDQQARLSNLTEARGRWN